MNHAGKQVVENLAAAVHKRDANLVASALEEAADAGMNRMDVVDALAGGLDRARRDLGDRNASVPEFLLAVDVMRAGLRSLDGLFGPAGNTPGHGTVVIGVARGDVHDLGKNIVASVMEACGYRVVDLGRDVPPDDFVRAVREHGAFCVAISSMMSTPLAAVRETVGRLARETPGVRVILGGAALDERLSRDMGADGWCENVVGVPEAMTRLGKGMRERVFVDYDNRVRVVEREVEEKPKS
ncbi:MAG: B12-binding domain-containing protein [Desulfatibacillaceae bacterium]